MAVTININNLSLCHKGSNGVAIATLPDVCKTPPGPVPVPYPNIAFSKHLKKGTKTIKVDGGNMAANKGSQFSRSTGDEPGVAKGIVSNTQMKEATWITHSFDVKLEKKGACRLTDKMFMNHKNTVCLGGELQKLLIVAPFEASVLCGIICACDKTPVKSKAGSELKEECVKLALDQLHNPPDNPSNMNAEISYNMTTKPPSPFMHRDSLGNATLKRSEYWQRRAFNEIAGYAGGKGMVRRPDVVIVHDRFSPPTQNNLKAVVEIKFEDKNLAQLKKDKAIKAQLKAYKKIAGKQAPVVVLTPEECDCGKKKKKKRQPQKKPVPLPVPAPKQVPAPSSDINWGKVGLTLGLGLLAVGLAVAPVPGSRVVAASLVGGLMVGSTVSAEPSSSVY